MNTLKIVWRWITNIAEAVFVMLSNVSSFTLQEFRDGSTEAARIGRAFIRAELIILAVMIGTFLIGFALNITALVVFSAFVTGIIVLITWKAGDLAVSAIASFAKIPLVGGTVKATADELKKLLPPMITVSLFCAFLSSIVAIKGVGYYTWTDLMIWTAFITFTAIFTVYVDSKIKIAGWAMIVFLYYLMIGNYIWPIQVQGTVDWVENKTVRQALVAVNKTKEDQIVVIAAGTPIYKEGWGGKFSNINNATGTAKAKVIGRANDNVSKETMYKVVLPIKGTEDVYVGGVIAYVPARLAKLIPRPSEFVGTANAATTQNDAPSPIKLSKGDKLVYELNPGDATPWVHAPTGVNYNVHPANNKPYRAYYWNGQVVDVGQKDKGAPIVCPATFKIINTSKTVETYEIAGM